MAESCWDSGGKDGIPVRKDREIRLTVNSVGTIKETKFDNIILLTFIIHNIILFHLLFHFYFWYLFHLMMLVAAVTVSALNCKVILMQNNNKESRLHCFLLFDQTNPAIISDHINQKWCISIILPPDGRKRKINLLIVTQNEAW